MAIRPAIKIVSSPRGQAGPAGGVIAPGTTVVDNIVVFNDITGQELKDSGIPVSDVTTLQSDVTTLQSDVTTLETVVNPASASAPASLDLHEDTDNGTNKITIIAPSAVASDKVLTLPDASGTISTIENNYAPRGFMLNGKIAVTDAAGITVAIKTLAGTDPSATDPVYVRIGDTVRSITSALSRSLADGTNWFNAGGAVLATNEIDYFAYLVWDSNSSAVALSFSRISYANLVSNFSATTTAEKYCAGYSDFTTTDEVENIGRFAATLSAGAGYTWAVPTYTANNLIQKPINVTRTLNFNQSWINVIIGNGTQSATYHKIDNIVFFSLTLTFGTTSSVSGADPNIAMPTVAVKGQHTTVYLNSGVAGHQGAGDFGGSAITPIVQVVSGGNIIVTGITTTIPFVGGTADTITIGGFYEE